MRVLVRVEVRRLEPRVQHALHLCRQLLINANSPERHGAHQLRDRHWKWRFADQYQVHSDIERWIFARQPHRIVKGGSGTHDGGRGENALAMRLDDALVHVTRETEIIGIDNQLPH